MASRQFKYEEFLEPQTTTNNGEIAGSILFLPDDPATYYFFVTCGINTASASNPLEFYFYDSASAIYNLLNTHDTANYYSIGGAYFLENPGIELLMSVHYGPGSGATAVTIQDLRILTIKADALDQHIEGGGGSTTSTDYSAAGGQAATLTISTTGDYLIIAGADIQHSNTGTSGLIRLLWTDSTATDHAFNEMKVRPLATTDRRPWMAVKKISATAGDTVKIQCAVVTTNTTTVNFPRIIAINLATVDNNYYAESLGREVTTSTTYQDKVSLTQTPITEEHMVSYNAIIDQSSNTNSINAKGLQDSTDKQVVLVEPNLGVGNDDYMYCCISKETLPASSTTWKIQYARVGALSSAGIDDGAISVIQLTGGTTVKILGGVSILGNTKIL